MIHTFPFSPPLLSCDGLRAVLGAVLLGAVLPGHQVRVGAHPTGVQVHDGQGGGLLDLLAGRGHCHSSLDRHPPNGGALMMI